MIDPSHSARLATLGLSRREVLGGILGASAALAAPGALARGLPNVVATTGMIADLARRIGGARIAVKGLMGPGIDPHSYRQTRSDVAALARADLVLWHGLYLEAQMEDLLHDLGRKRDVVAVAEALPKDLLHAKGDGSTHYDPHVWMSPRLWSGVIAPVTDALSGLDPDGAPEFAANAALARAEFEALAVYADKVLGSIPDHARLLVTAHDAFSYFGRAFGLEVAGIQGMSTESEAGLARIETLVKLLVEREVGAVFVESSVPERNVRALIEGAQARGHKVIVGGELFSDAMGPEGTYEGGYPGMIDHNVTVIARALGGDAPERGLRGLLSAAS